MQKWSIVDRSFGEKLLHVLKEDKKKTCAICFENEDQDLYLKWVLYNPQGYKGPSLDIEGFGKK